ncbi:MAG: FlgO family outer membrane protein [Comamonadaceae bacterium]|nr:FlgO family outer membrane protein [Comamonadaceae bacterium]
MKVQFLASALAAAALVAGCANHTNTVRVEPSYQDAANNSFLKTNQNAALQLIGGYDTTAFQNSPLLVATIVDVNDTRVSAPLGRTLSEQYASTLANAGMNVREIKLRGNVFVQEGTGELLLSREIQDIAKSQNSGVVLVGTYSAAARFTYVSLKLVRTQDSRIVSAYDYTLPNNRDVRRLLQSN